MILLSIKASIKFFLANHSTQITHEKDIYLTFINNKIINNNWEETLTVH